MSWPCIKGYCTDWELIGDVAKTAAGIALSPLALLSGDARQEAPTAKPTGMAAVVVIDNKFGLPNVGLSSEPLNEAWKQVMSKTLAPYYDEVIIVTGHHKEKEGNPVLKALSNATSRFASVDLFADTHTGTIVKNSKGKNVPGIAQIPIGSFEDALDFGQRSRLRLLYSMGCYDGNEKNEKAISAIQDLGFETFVGHEGEAPNFIGSYSFLVRYLNGQGVQSAVSATNEEVTRCLPRIGKVIDDHKEAVYGPLEDFLDCSRAARSDQFEMAICVARLMPGIMPAVNDVMREIKTCMPSLFEGAQHIDNAGLSILTMLSDAAGGYGNKEILKHTLGMWFPGEDRDVFFKDSHEFDGKQAAGEMTLKVFGKDIDMTYQPEPSTIMEKLYDLFE